MTHVAIGARMHSGWGVLVTVSHSADTVQVIDRRRLAITDPGTVGANQPYHFAERLALPEAEKFIANCFAASARLASAAVRELVDELRGRDCHVVGSVVLCTSGRQLPPLSKILSSHPLIHAAEGEFFRKAFWKACEALDLSVTGFEERKLDEHAQKTFGKAATRMSQLIITLGRTLGPPWTKDQQMTALAASVLLANEKR